MELIILSLTVLLPEKTTKTHDDRSSFWAFSYQWKDVMLSSVFKHFVNQLPQQEMGLAQQIEHLPAESNHCLTNIGLSKVGGVCCPAKWRQHVK